MSTAYKDEQEPLFARESLFRQKLNQLRSTGEIQRNTANLNQTRFKEIEQSQYLHNIQTSHNQTNPEYLSKAALLDPLTELYNHSTVCRILKEEIKRAQRYRHDLAVLALTINSLNKLAEQGGPIAFDTVVRGVAQFLLHTIRDVDIPARYDRNHFVLICPETNMPGAMCLAERLSNKIQVLDIADIGKNWHVNLNMGIATFPDVANSSEHLIATALASLALSQRTGS